MARRQIDWPFGVRNLIVWILMTVILVVVPDSLERWMPLAIARVLGWAVACSVWVVAVEARWQRKLSPVSRGLATNSAWTSQLRRPVCPLLLPER